MVRIARASLERAAAGLRVNFTQARSVGFVCLCAVSSFTVALGLSCALRPGVARADELPVEALAASQFAVDHSVTFAVTPDLPGVIEVSPRVNEVTAVRALLVIDGKLHRISLKREGELFRGTFPSPWKRMEYRLQLATANAGVQLSPNFVAEQNCRNSSLLAGQSGKAKLSAAREALLKEAILLDDDIRRLNYVEGVISGMSPSAVKGAE